MTTINKDTSSGLRYNTGKLPLHLISWKTIEEVAKVLQFGATKYAPRNWEKGLSYSDTFSSLQRHLMAWFGGERNDPETKLPHLAHVMCNAMFLLHFELTGTGRDDRPLAQPEAPSTTKEQDAITELQRPAHLDYPLVASWLSNVQAHLRPPTERGCGCDRRMARHHCSHTNSE